MPTIDKLTHVPFDYGLISSVALELVVSQASIVDARDLLRSFDMVMAQSSFDGLCFIFILFSPPYLQIPNQCCP